MFTKTDKSWLQKNFTSKNDLKNLAKKDDLKNFVTKNDIKNFATKDDLKKLASKDDLKNFATKDDLDKTNTSINKLEKKLDKKFTELFDFLDDDVMKNKRRLKVIEETLNIVPLS